MSRILFNHIQLFFLLLLCTSCAQIGGNTVDRLRSPAQYGVDKFTVNQMHNAHYVEVGEGPPAILIPGLFGTYRGWSRMMPLLAPYYRLIALDNFGTGDSELPGDDFGYTVSEQADMIVSMMDELNIDRSTFIGVSYGGMIALNIAARYPDRVTSVVCIEGAVIMPKPPPYGALKTGLDIPLLGEAIIGLIRSGLLHEVIAGEVMGPAWKEMENREKDEIREIIAQFINAASRRTWLRLALALERSGDFPEEAKGIRAPVLYLSGEMSSFRSMTDTNISFLKEHLPGTRLVSFDDGVHDLQLQKPEETAAVILDFLLPEAPMSLVMSEVHEEVLEQGPVNPVSPAAAN